MNEAREHATRPFDHRLMIVVTSNARRGAEVFGSHLAGALRERRWAVDLVSLWPSVGGPAIDSHVVSESPRSGSGRFDLSVVRGLRKLSAEIKPDLVLANGGGTLRPSLFAARGRAPVAYVSIGEPAYWARGRARQRLLTTTLSRCRGVIAVSTAGRCQLVDMGVPAERIAVCHPGVEPIAGRHERAGGPLRLLYLGALTPEKDPVDMARTVIDARSRGSAIDLRVVGGGPLVDEVTRIVGPTALVGPVSDVAPHLAWADLLILTSRTEGLPGVVLEAASAGVPALAYRVGGVADAIVEGETGILVKAGDHAAMVGQLAYHSSHIDAVTAMGAAARVRYQGEFTIGAAADRYDAALRAYLGDDRNGS